MPQKCEQLCQSHIELRAKTEMEFALLKQAMTYHLEGLAEAKLMLAECAEEVGQAVETLNKGTVELARYDERLKTGAKRFSAHAALIVGLYACILSVGGFVIAIHGVEALKSIKIPI